MSATQSNSLAEIRASGAGSKQRAAILELLSEHPEGLTRAEIAERLDMRLSSVCGRVGELKEDLQVISAPTVRLDPNTGKNVRPVISVAF